MGWRGTLRSVQAAIRAAERDARRRQRELERYSQAVAKANELERAAYEVEVYRNRLERLVSLHKEVSSPINWQKLSQIEPPRRPQRMTSREDSARQILEAYRPSFITRLLKRAEIQHAKLVSAVEAGRSQDETTFRDAGVQYEAQCSEWKEQKELADRVLSGDPAAYLEVIKEINPFSEISDLGSAIRFEVLSPQLVKAELTVHGEAVVPRETKSLLKTGKLSTKQTPKTEFYRLCQDYISSCVLRVARELFAILPIDSVVVTALDNLVNSSTGHLEEQPILSALVPKATMERMNLDLIDPSDSMVNFVHKMNFKPTSGFRPVERVSVSVAGMVHASYPGCSSGPESSAPGR